MIQVLVSHLDLTGPLLAYYLISHHLISAAEKRYINLLSMAGLTKNRYLTFTRNHDRLKFLNAGCYSYGFLVI